LSTEKRRQSIKSLVNCPETGIWEVANPSRRKSLDSDPRIHVRGQNFFFKLSWQSSTGYGFMHLVALESRSFAQCGSLVRKDKQMNYGTQYFVFVEGQIQQIGIERLSQLYHGVVPEYAGHKIPYALLLFAFGSHL
jgi:hypothetical protein